MGRAPLQLKGCPIVYFLKFHHHAIVGRRGTLPAPGGESACMEL